MLDGLRKYASSWAAQLLMGLLVLSFAAWGVNDVFNGFRSNDIAMVGSTPVTINDFQRTYQLAMTDLAQRLGQQLTPDQAKQFGVPNQVLSQLVSQATLNNTADQLGIGVSDKQLTKAIGADPRFLNSSGAFDKNIFGQAVRSMGFTPDDFILNQRQSLERGQLAQAFGGGIVAPTAYLQAVHDYTLEERDISYIVLTAPPATDIADPSETDLSAYFEQHKAEWKAPELRAVTYYSLSPADITDIAEVSDDDAKKAYDAQPARFSQPEKRKVEQIVFKDRTEADAASAALAGGKTFDALITERNLKPTDVDLGLVTKDKIADTAIADAAFAAALNMPTPVVEGQFGPAILRVTEIDPSVTTSFDQAKADLKKEIATQRAATEVGSTRDTIEDARAAGSTSAEIAAKYGLKILTIPAIDNAGHDADGNAVANVPTGLVQGVFDSDVGTENDPIQPEANTYIWYDVTAVTAPRDRALSEVHDKVLAAWKDAERVKRLDQTADGAKQRLDNKEDINAVATALGATVKTAPKLTRTAKATDDFSTGAIAAAFAGPKDSVVLADGAAPMTRLVMRVDNINVPAFDPAALDLANTKQTLDGQFLNAFLGLYVAEIQNQTKVTLNQIALQQVLGTGDTAN